MPRRVATPPSAVAIAFGLLWWLIAVPIAFQNGPGSAIVFVAVPYTVIAAHEAGHFVMALLARASLAGAVVRIGIGPSVGVGTRAIRLGVLPGSGRVELVGALRRSQRFVFALGGILGNVALTIALVLLDRGSGNTPVVGSGYARARASFSGPSILPGGMLRPESVRLVGSNYQARAWASCLCCSRW
jgi:hypothetical protein